MVVMFGPLFSRVLVKLLLKSQRLDTREAVLLSGGWGGGVISEERWVVTKNDGTDPDIMMMMDGRDSSGAALC